MNVQEAGDRQLPDQDKSFIGLILEKNTISKKRIQRIFASTFILQEIAHS